MKTWQHSESIEREMKQIIIIPAATTPPWSIAAEIAYQNGEFPPTPIEQGDDWFRCDRATFLDGHDANQCLGIVVGRSNP
jgi:hypothetical protein